MGLTKLSAASNLAFWQEVKVIAWCSLGPNICILRIQMVWIIFDPVQFYFICIGCRLLF
jgi:hypothetical protein